MPCVKKTFGFFLGSTKHHSHFVAPLSASKIAMFEVLFIRDTDRTTKVNPVNETNLGTYRHILVKEPGEAVFAGYIIFAALREHRF